MSGHFPYEMTLPSGVISSPSGLTALVRGNNPLGQCHFIGEMTLQGVPFPSQKTDFEQMTLKTEEIRGSFHMGNNLDKRVISQEMTPILAK